jgi:hypothetical protein
MTKKKKTLVKESVVRRWGKLAAMPALTENWLDTIAEDDAAEEDDEAAVDLEKAAMGDDPSAELDYAEGDLERAGDEDLSGLLDSDDAQALVAGIAQQVADMLGVDADVEVEDEDLDVEMDMEEEIPAMGMDSYNRQDERKLKGKPSKTRHGKKDFETHGGDKDEHEDGHDIDKRPYAGNRTDENSHKLTRGQRSGDKTKQAPKRGARATRDKDSDNEFGDGSLKKEFLDIEVVDDSQLTEAVLQRVIERLLSRK